MIRQTFDWKLEQSQAPSSFLKIAKKEGLKEEVGRLLYQRGIDSAEALQAFLKPDLSQLHDPYLLHDMDKAVERIRQAIATNEIILIYGDYDADGMTAASIMKECLEEMGAEIEVYLPNRFTDGYGPNASVYKYFIENHAVSLILTVDNGVAGHEAIDLAQSMGVDVIVTDHHALPQELPNAYAIVHPEHPEGHYPFKYLAGCGVAFKLAQALLEDTPIEFLDLVAIGTIADMVSLTDENRILVKYGLSMLKKTARFGLLELYGLADIDPSQITEETVGFQLAPRLNALGRLDDPNPALELLTGFDEEEMEEIARLINDKNEERKEIVQTIFREARSMVKPDQAVQVLAKEGWNPGVLGIVAGRLLEELGQTVIVLNIENGQAKGSARSIQALNIFDALDPHRDIFTAFGGHAGAAGMTLPQENLARLEEILLDYVADKKIDIHQKNSLLIDQTLDLEELSLESLLSLDQLAPFGMDHKKPVYMLEDVQVESARSMGQDGSHLKLKIKKGKTNLEVVAFGQGQHSLEFQQAKNLDLAVHLSLNSWNGQRTLQLMFVDARVNGIQLYDIRGSQQELPIGVPLWPGDQDLSSSKQVVIDRIPEKPEELREFLASQDFEAIYFKNRIQPSYYLTGYGSRDQYTKLYKVIYQYPEFDVRHKLDQLAHFLKIDRILLIKMIRIFEELGFVAIKDGVMTVNKEAQRRPIEESSIYQELKETVLYQESLALSSPSQIYEVYGPQEKLAEKSE